MATVSPKRHHKRGLTNCLPRAGFRFEYNARGGRLCQRRRYDKIISEALCLHVGLTMEEAEPRLADIFRDAAAIAGQHDGDFLEMIEPLQNGRAWTSELPQPVMVELVRELFEARARWHRDRRPPFDMGHHGELSKAIDALADIVGASWTVGVEELYRLAGGYLETGSGEESGGDDKVWQQYPTSHIHSPRLGQFGMQPKMTDQAEARQRNGDKKKIS